MCVGKLSHINMKTLSQILEYTKLNEETMCMEWQRCFNTDGYPRMGIAGNSNIKVHRLVYELANQRDITGLVVRHWCDNPKCINPEHLLCGTHADNMKDKRDRNRQPKKITAEIVQKVKKLLATEVLQQKEIADLVGIDQRRVSDINRNLYTDDGHIVRR